MHPGGMMLAEPGFIGDISPIIRDGIVFSPESAANVIYPLIKRL
jgi:hypothetical protein